MVTGFGSCVLCIGIGASANHASKTMSAQPQNEPPMQVQIGNILDAYKGNELGADNRYKGQWIQVTGSVTSIKKDILDNPYITLGTGKRFELPQVQCFLRSSDTAAASRISQGQNLTVKGRVEGLMGNVLVKDCSIAP